MTTEPQAQPPEAVELKPIYVASRASIPERGKMWRSFRSQGYLITSSWIDEDGECATEDFGDLWVRIANEIRRSAALVLYAKAADFPLKGALTEAGIALGMGKPVFVCLPDLGVLPRNYRPIGSWITHPLVTRCDLIKKAVWLASHACADLPRVAADDDAIGFLAANWAETLSQGEQDVLLTSSLKRLSVMIAEHVSTTPRAQTGLSVEAALAELRELTPHCCNVSFLTTGGIVITVYANSIVPLELLRTERTTLDESMDQVRAWAESRAEREGENNA